MFRTSRRSRRAPSSRASFLLMWMPNHLAETPYYASLVLFRRDPLGVMDSVILAIRVAASASPDTCGGGGGGGGRTRPRTSSLGCDRAAARACLLYGPTSPRGASMPSLFILANRLRIAPDEIGQKYSKLSPSRIIGVYAGSPFPPLGGKQTMCGCDRWALKKE